jgi:hypothetical protein
MFACSYIFPMTAPITFLGLSNLHIKSPGGITARSGDKLRFGILYYIKCLR